MVVCMDKQCEEMTVDTLQEDKRECRSAVISEEETINHCFLFIKYFMIMFRMYTTVASNWRKEVLPIYMHSFHTYTM